MIIIVFNKLLMQTDSKEQADLFRWPCNLLLFTAVNVKQFKFSAFWVTHLQDKALDLPSPELSQHLLFSLSWSRNRNKISQSFNYLAFSPMRYMAPNNSLKKIPLFFTLCPPSHRSTTKGLKSIQIWKLGKRLKVS